MSSTTDKIAGNANEVAGKVRQGVGDAIDDREMQANGIVQEAKGDAQQVKGDAKEKLRDLIDHA